MDNRNHRPILELLSSSWLSMLGTSLVTAAGVSWLAVLPMQVRGNAENPYIGLLVFIVIPVIFCLGLVLIPAGIYLARRRIRQGFEAEPLAPGLGLRRVGVFFSITTVPDLVDCHTGS